MYINPLLCPGETPTFLIFDFFTAPHLLFYSYVPTVIISLIIAIFVLKNDSNHLRGKMFFYFILFFVLWVLNIFIQWLASYIVILMFFWQTLILLEVPIFIFALFFTYSFINNVKRIPLSYKISALIVYLGVVISVPTTLVITSYDIINCEGIYGPIWQLIFIFETAITLLIGYMCLRKYLSKQSEMPKREIILFGIGMITFLSFFIFSNVYADMSSNYLINFYGPLGLTIFLAVLSFLMVKFQAFNRNRQIIGANLLFFALLAITASILFIADVSTIRIVVSVSLIAMVIFGDMFINSVRREIKTKEALSVANKRQENLIHIMNHQIKSYFTVAKNIFAELSEGETYGKMTDEMRPAVLKGMQEMNDGVDYVQGILKGESAQSGNLPIDTTKPVNLKIMIENLISKQREVAEKSGLTLVSKISDGNYNILGDAVQLGEAFKNLFTNAIKYNNPNGNIEVTLSNVADKILFTVRDTGRGITAEDQKKLFTPGGMGKDSLKYNTDSSGYGLAFVKPVIEKHEGGRIWYETKVGKGTTFFVELSAKTL